MVFWVSPVWDAEAQVFISESNIKGFHIEASTESEFLQIVSELAHEMIIENHYENAKPEPLRRVSMAYGEQSQ